MLQNNYLDRQIPAEIGSLDKLTTLDLRDNGLWERSPPRSASSQV